MDAREHLDEVERWHADRVARLVGTDGWLTVTGLFWLRPGANTVGSDATCDVRLPRVPATVGSIELDGGRVVARVEPSARVTVDGAPVSGALELRTDRDPGGPTILRVDPLSFFVIDREGRLAVRVRDSESPAREGFRGIERFPVDLRWRVEASFEPHDAGTTVLAPDVLGAEQTYRNPGTVRFDIEGRPCALEAFREPDEEELFIVFGDATNGVETFAGGRYLYAKLPEGGRVVMDFNRAYNPPCVFTEFATCVLPPPRNRLPVRIAAGEKRYGDH